MRSNSRERSQEKKSNFNSTKSPQSYTSVSYSAYSRSANKNTTLNKSKTRGVAAVNKSGSYVIQEEEHNESSS